MNARFSRLLLSAVWMMVLALGLLPAAQAQEEPKPEAVGLRPDAPPYALHGPYWVGTREFVIDPDGERPLPLTVWYPALNPDGVAEEINYIYDNFVSIEGFTQPGHAIADAVPDSADGPYPLVIISHGAAGHRYVFAYLAEHLASQGFVVMAVDHTGNTLGYAVDMALAKPDASGFVDGELNAIVLRPKDIQRQIDYASSLTAQGGNLDGMIDDSRIAVAGHSFGADTAALAAGAQVDFKPFQTWCDENAGNETVKASFKYTVLCSLLVPYEGYLLTTYGINARPGEMWPPFDVVGVDAIVPISLDLVFTQEGLSHVTIPALMMVGTNDSAYAYDATVSVYGNLPGEQKGLVVFENADHLFSMGGCLPWYQEHQAQGACGFDAVWDIDRAHDLVDHFTTAFLLATLKGDTDAAAVLAPDQVQFPGIEYQTTGF